MPEQELLQLERAFWLAGAPFYDEHLASEVLMVFPPPVGVLDRIRTLETILEAPRWKDVAFSAVHIIAPAPDVAILAYEATAHRGNGESEYRAQCSSTYVRVEGKWRLGVHQQGVAGSGQSRGSGDRSCE
jgi:hypothetical protein